MGGVRGPLFVAFVTILAGGCDTGGVSQGESPPASHPIPNVSFFATPSAISSGETAQLVWSATHATSCTASGGWGGVKVVSGNETVGPLYVTSNYMLTCTGAGGSADRAATVTVTGGGGAGNFFEELFNNNYVANKVTGDSSYSWVAPSVANGAWDDGGWMRFVPPTLDNAYTSLNTISFPTLKSVVHVRFLYYISAALPPNQASAKVFIMTRAGGPSGSRVMMHGFRDASDPNTWNIASDNNINSDNPSGSWFNTAGYHDQWVCFEIGVSIPQNYRRLWVTTRDGVYDQRLVQDLRLAMSLNYSGQSADFTVGSRVTGQTSGATGVVLSDTDNGSSGSLLLQVPTGEFIDGEFLTDEDTGSANVSGVLYQTYGQLFDQIDVLGQYSNAGSTRPPGTFFGVDDVAVNDSGYIGPPVGFVVP